MNSLDARTVPADPRSQQRLQENGFSYRVVDMADADAAVAFARAAQRGFLEDDPSDAELAQLRSTWADRRNIGVYEAELVGRPAAAALPVGTVNSWVAEMTVPGGTIPMWAISMVTVAATHRRRGIARGLLEGELRAAASAGVPLAGLTVTEATIYGRYGFGPAIPVSRVGFDTRRAGWSAPAAPGRLEYVDNDRLAADLAAVHTRARGLRTGQIDGWDRRWLGLSSIGPDGAVKDRSARGVRYLDADGELRGAMAYGLKPLPGGFGSTLTVRHLAAETDEAQRALWGHAANHDLVERVEADLRPADDPIVHLVTDQRAVDFAVHDHGWLRILDLPAALRARRCGGPADVVLRVSDPYGFADGTWRVRADASGEVSAEPADAGAAITLGVAELSTAYAGGVTLSRLAAAGRVSGDPGAIAELDRALRTDPAPFLGIWY